MKTYEPRVGGSSDFDKLRAGQTVPRRFGLRATLVVALTLGGAGAGSVLLTQVGQPYLVLFAAAAAGAIAAPLYNINQVSYRQAIIDARLQGRVNATMRTIVWGTLPLGSLAGGYLAAAVGVPATILASALISGCAALWLMPIVEPAAVSAGRS